ncbi:anti-sigma factor [Bacillus sp. 03113]|uniref:anti-sigma factor family protein n=1 Tax=Bacillus sp. 03113 TaxID=2578211 RepID=UPI0011417202|nr:anti-sigma factor [Bacillus sp. 03113]
MKCPGRIVELMHEFLDEEISADHEKELRMHLQNCKECHAYFHELKRVIAFVQSTSHIQAPANFTENIMAKLPKEKRKVGVQRWLKHHPVMTAASLFLVLMMGSLLSMWNEDQQFSVSKQPNLVVQNDTVTVPKGEVVKGDVIVQNGKLHIEGEVDGNVTIINGEKYMASAGKVTGEIKEVNEVFEWLWYHIKKTATNVMNIFDNGKEANA